MQDNALFSVIDAKKYRLKRQVLNELYQAGPQSIAQLAKLVHSSVPSMTALIDELILGGWVRGIGTGAAQFGRKPSLFALNPEQYVIVVVDSTVHDTKLFVFNLLNKVRYRVDLPLQLTNSTHFVEQLETPLQTLADQIRADRLVVVGVGAALPGLVNPVQGINHTYPEISQPEGSLNQLLKTLFNAPVFFINDTKAIMLGEHRFGLAQGRKHVISMLIDWGVGMGVIINGYILQGTAGFAGELGHIQVDPDGERCYCGKIGCLDTQVSAPALIRRAQAGLQNGRVSRLAGSEALTIETIIGEANAGDAFAIELLDEAGRQLGRGLAIAVHLFNPELIIVNGVLAQAERAIIRPIEEAIDTYCLPNYRDNLTVALSQLGEMAKPCGAQAFVMQQLLENELIP